ncbi:MAG: PilZ domain-containing protein [Thermoleophilia bacterium]
MAFTRRRHHRAVLVRSTTVVLGTGRRERAGLIDLSVGGALLYCEAPLAIGDRIGIDFDAEHDGLSLALQAVVRRADRGDAPRGRYAVEFEGLDGDQQLLLARFVSTVERRRAAAASRRAA